MRPILRLAAALVTLVGGCQACPAFDPAAPDDQLLSTLEGEELDAFCREQASFVSGMLDRATFERGYCLHRALAQLGTPERRVTDAASCQTFVEDCVAGSPDWPWVTDCDLTYVACRGESVGERRACVTEMACTTWIVWATELDCAMFGTPEVRAVLDRASSAEACRVLACI